MNPFTPAEWIEREAQRQAHLARIAVEHPILEDDELRELCRKSTRDQMDEERNLKDWLLRGDEHEGQFCAWGGLNPHRVAAGEDEPRCRACQRNEACTQPFKVGGW